MHPSLPPRNQRHTIMILVTHMLKEIGDGNLLPSFGTPQRKYAIVATNALT
jgi:hypothetical protein